ncbi:MAG: metallophosphoesterase [Candidatus Marsarchaeota archaeon]|nr:metallophosphoesterase [Candidatus Marsarchaeota archaeon]
MHPLISERAILLEDTQELIVGELHFGLGEGINGTLVQQTIYKETMADLERMIKKYDVKKLVINGDLKDSIGIPTGFEIGMLKGLHRLLEELSIEAVLVKGNHDGSIERYISFGCVKSYKTRGASKNILVIHGDSILSDANSCDVLVTAHLHPVVQLEKRRIFAWLFMTRTKGRPEEIIVMPPFNSFVGGAAIEVNRAPLLKKFYRGSRKWTTYVIGTDGLLYGDLESVSRG